MAGRVIGRCVQNTPYTGHNRCSKGEGLTDALIFHDPSVSYSAVSETFISELPALVYSPSTDRIYPVKNIINVDISGGDTNTSDSGSGFTVPTSVSQVIATYTLSNDDCLFKQLKKMEGVDWRVFRVDQDEYIYGTIYQTASEERFRGFLCQIKVRRIAATGTDSAYLYLEIYYSAKYEKELENLNGFFIGEENVPDGLVPVVVETTADGSVVVGECSGADYTSLYANEWGTVAFLYSGGNAESLVYNAETNTITLTPEGTYRIADASVLATLDIYGITGVPLT